MTRPCVVYAAISAGESGWPYISYMHVRYTSDQLTRRSDLIGKPLRVCVDNRDLRTLRAFTHDGQLLSDLQASGIWPGRVARRYRRSVSQLNADYQLQLPLAATRAGWLLMPPLASVLLQRLAGFARIPVRQLEAIQMLVEWLRQERSYRYCKHCLGMNPQDLTAPFWKRRWFKPGFEQCAEHVGPLASLGACQIGKCGNMRDIVKSAEAKARK